MIIKIEVTRDDLDNGLRSNGENCPIALAVKRAVKIEYSNKFLDELEVDGGIMINLDGDKYELDNSKQRHFIETFVSRYDAEDFVSPFELALSFEEQEREEDYGGEET